MSRVGIISDTHGLLRPEAEEFLRGCDFIIHGGDICDSSILERLAVIAPVTAIRGNNDKGSWAEDLAESDFLKVDEVYIYAIHDLAQIGIEPSGAGVHVVVSGHSHTPLIEEREGVLYVNPGSAGPRRFKLPISAAELIVVGASVTARIVEFKGENAAEPFHLMSNANLHE